ncbi:D-hexose-6-phosphate mutarotase [Marilutibacter spongiae]|uniref:Putative glucose-6-phosphate 1-epimerase n=1 Tax=Marilutibacter spongiae TaxID=2025720 RepID=A0A7W3Y4J3_9GAMM|nr:D-hexose-6-phosphate mutarotase [Lysobacter spongiae]MBB1059040.1 D-hexose-6-phosphate mutarotase [Lysobacter spongiae]
MRTFTTRAHGMHLRASDFGGHVLSWIARGREQLFCVPTERMAPGVAIRGGIPVIFPQFATRGSGQRHGFARLLGWEPGMLDAPGTRSFALVDSAATRRAWPHGFRLGLEARLAPDRLTVSLEVRNTGSDPFSCTLALHTYLQVEDAAKARLEGLQDHAYMDATRDDAQGSDPGPVTFEREIDRLYPGATQPLRLAEESQLREIRMTGFRDVVAWNPGPSKASAIPELEPGDHRRFVCVEAACAATPLLLSPGERWRGSQEIVLLEPPGNPVA